jgi:hypothetical protein
MEWKCLLIPSSVLQVFQKPSLLQLWAFSLIKYFEFSVLYSSFLFNTVMLNEYMINEIRENWILTIQYKSMCLRFQSNRKEQSPFDISVQIIDYIHYYRFFLYRNCSSISKYSEQYTFLLCSTSHSITHVRDSSLQRQRILLKKTFR